MLIYLAGPIDHVTDRISELKFGRDCTIRALRNAGIAWFDPSVSYGNPMEDPEATYRINEAALREADGLLALLPPGVPTTGTPMEIQRAYDAGKPVAVVGGAGSMQLRGMGVFQRIWADVADPFNDVVEWIKLSVGRRHAHGYQIRYTGDSELEPRRGMPGDAGFDLVVSQDTEVLIDSFVDVPCGVSVELPYDCWAMIVGRSSTLRKRRLLVNQGIIDQGYRGPLYAGVWNLGEDVVSIKKGERIAQLIPMPLTSAMLSLRPVAELSPSIRGASGFGSTGC